MSTTDIDIHVDVLNSDFEVATIKQVGDKITVTLAKKANKYPMTVEESKAFLRPLFNEINYKSIYVFPEYYKPLHAFKNLIRLRDAWNKVDGFVPDWERTYLKFCIEVFKDVARVNNTGLKLRPLFFKSRETAELFLKTFSSLIEDAKELI